MHPYTAIIILGFFSGITTLLGLWLAYHVRRDIYVAMGIGFSAGIMLSISFFELIPEAISASSKFSAIFSLILGFSVIMALHYAIPHTHFMHNGSKLLRIGFLVGVGMILHDFPEGFAMANSYIFKPTLGLLVALSIAVHNIPEEFAMALPLVLTKKRKLLVHMALLSALAEPMGALLGIFAVFLSPALNPLMLAFAAGAMIFVSIDELLPLARTYKKTNMFLLGIGLSLIVYFGLSQLF